MIRSKKVLRSAQGQPCFLKLPGICNCDPDTTVWAHLNGGEYGKGMGIKAHDIAGFPACSSCHSAYDLNAHGLGAAHMSAILLRAVVNAMVMLIERKIIIVPLDIDTPMLDRQVKPRKPKAERAKIQSRSSFPKRAK